MEDGNARDLPGCQVSMGIPSFEVSQVMGAPPVSHFFVGMFHEINRPGWWLTYHLEKSEFVNGKDDIPYFMEK